MNKLCRLFTFLLLLSVYHLTFAKIDDDFKKNLDYANSVRGRVQKEGEKFDPAAVFGKDYNPEPEQGKYFEKGTQPDDKGLKNDAINHVSQDQAGQGVVDAFKTRPIYHVDTESATMKKSKLIQEDSHNISRGISDKYVDCSAKKKCHTIDVTENCNEVTRYIDRTCTRIPKVTIVDQPYTETRTYSGSISPNSNTSGTFVLPVSGTITSFDVVLKARGNIWKCKVDYYGYIQSSYLSTYHGGCGGGLSDLDFHNHGFNAHGDGNQPISFYFTNGPSSGQWARANYNLTIQAELHRKVAQVEWVENCSGHLDGGICTDKDKVCTEPGGTRYFDGVPVTLDCWNYSVTQQCTGASDNNCKALRDKGCSQFSSQCRVKLSDYCVVQDETYHCPVEKCDPADGIVCGREFFCMNGDCSSHDNVINNDFGKDAARLAAISSAAQDVANQNIMNPHIFTGEAMECSITIAGAKDCCKDTGWAKGLFLNCDDDEKKLGLSKEKGLVVAAGDDGNNEYCHNRVLGVCTSYHKVYCVFPSKLSRIVQQQGRHDQLGISFGYVDDDSAHPDCRGITPEELQRIDFSKIDFSEVISDIEKNIQLPDTQVTEKDIMQHVQDFYDKHQKHG